ncbi:hypothetical protein AQ443_13735 [Listeria monocytogenes]|nr:hypothetical protein [Listeria monocytogenes]EAG1723515.1 hypothetical protein [Listeria monocytogenes]
MKQIVLGDPVDFKDAIVTGSVDTTQPGVYQVDYSYGGMTSTATIIVLETILHHGLISL